MIFLVVIFQANPLRVLVFLLAGVVNVQLLQNKWFVFLKLGEECLEEYIFFCFHKHFGAQMCPSFPY